MSAWHYESERGLDPPPPNPTTSTGISLPLPAACPPLHPLTSLDTNDTTFTNEAWSLEIESLHQKSSTVDTPPTGTTWPGSTAPDDEFYTELRNADDIYQWVCLFFPELTQKRQDIRDLIVEVYSAGSAVFGADKARRWAQGFVVPQHAVDQDRAALRAEGNDFLRLVRAKQASMHAGRLNRQRIDQATSINNPERDRLLLLADGMPLLNDPNFRGSTLRGRPKQSQSFLEARPAVEKMMYNDFWEQGLAIILTEDDVSTLPLLGLCLAKKQGKECGRPIVNGSGRRSMLPEEILNSAFAKDQALAIFGEIKHPVIGDVPRMISQFESSSGLHRNDLTLWKFDLRKAYLLLTYDAEDVPKICVELSDGRFMFFLVGVFGLTAMPYAFQVVTRAIVWEIAHNAQFRGILKMYVDDGIIVCHRDDVVHTQNIIFTFVRNLLGNDAIETSKTKQGRQLDFIGYSVDMDSEVVMVAHNNLRKALYAFLNVDLEDGARVPVRQLQGLASLGSRYGYISHLMRPYVRTLYSSFIGRRNWGHVILTSDTKRVIRLFRCLFVNLALQGTQFSRPFSSFESRPATWVCEYDASLSGIGIMWFQILPDGQESLVAYTSVDISSLGFGTNAAYQNTAEYIASLLCAHGMNLLGVGHEPVLHRGDSKTALAWVQRGTAKSDSAVHAGLLWGLFVMIHQSDVVGTLHLSHQANGRADILSRHGSWTEVIRLDRSQFGGSLPTSARFLDLNCAHLLQLCNPSLPVDTDESFSSFFRDALRAISK